MKTKLAKQLATKIRYSEWEEITFNFYYKRYLGFDFYKRNVSLNYWQYTVKDDITHCTFLMYEKEAVNAKLGNERTHLHLSDK